MRDYTFYMFFVWAVAMLLAVWAARVAQRFGMRVPRLPAAEIDASARPKVAVILPIKGVDDDTTANLEALLTQDYAYYRLIFAVESENDPVVPVLEKLATEDSRIEIVVAGIATERGQKIQNQLAAVERTTEKDEVLAFMDADARPKPNWLTALVAPLTWRNNMKIALSTGYRYYIPVTGHMANKIVSIINAQVAALFGPYRRTFAWGGSMAIWRGEFLEIGLPKMWSNAVSDDYVMSHAIKRVAGKRIHFVPQCIVASDANFNWGTFFEFAVRQYRITKICEPLIWLTAVGGATLYLAAFLYTLWRAVLGFIQPELVPDHTNQILMFSFLYMASIFRGYMLVLGGRRLLPEHDGEIKSALFWATIGFPWTMFIHWMVLIGSAFGREIVWRGVEYIMHSRVRTTVRRPHVSGAGSGAGHETRRDRESVQR